MRALRRTGPFDTEDAALVFSRRMQVDLRDAARRRIGRVQIDPAQRPALLRVVPRDAAPDAQPQDVFLHWDQAVDDAGCLRHCVVCRGRLYRTRTLPQVTPIVVVLAAAGVLVAAFGLAANPWVYGALVTVLLLDIAVLVFSRTRLVCYRCGSLYDRLRVARYHRAWDPREAESSAAGDQTSSSDSV